MGVFWPPRIKTGWKAAILALRGGFQHSWGAQGVRHIPISRDGSSGKQPAGNWVMLGEIMPGQKGITSLAMWFSGGLVLGQWPALCHQQVTCSINHIYWEGSLGATSKPSLRNHQIPYYYYYFFFSLTTSAKQAILAVN